MGILSAFVILVIDVVLWMLPVQGAIQSFRTNEITNSFTVSVSASGNVTATLSQALFNADTSLVAVSSNNSADTPVAAGYDDSSRLLTVAGLTPLEDAILTVAFFVDAFPNQVVWSGLLTLAPYLFILILCILPVVSVWLFVQSVRGRH